MILRVLLASATCSSASPPTPSQQVLKKAPWLCPADDGSKCPRLQGAMHGSCLAWASAFCACSQVNACISVCPAVADFKELIEYLDTDALQTQKIKDVLTADVHRKRWDITCRAAMRAIEPGECMRIW